MTSGSSIQAIEHSVPPHFGPVSISMVLKVTPTLGNVLMLKGTPTQGNVQGDKFTLTPFILTPFIAFIPTWVDLPVPSFPMLQWRVPNQNTK